MEIFEAIDEEWTKVVLVVGIVARLPPPPFNKNSSNSSTM